VGRQRFHLSVRVTSEAVLSENSAMLAMCAELGFHIANDLIRLALLPVASISDLAPDPSNRADEIRFQLSSRHLRACATGDKRQAPRQLRAA
jgi:hypothetical protein